MSANKSRWSEGLALSPQHFQNQERYLEQFVDERTKPLNALFWGIGELTINKESLGIGQVSLESARAVFKDGTPYNAPGRDRIPLSLNIPEGTSNEVVYLALPEDRAGSLLVDEINAPMPQARFGALEYDVYDYNVGSQGQTEIEGLALSPRLCLESQNLDGLSLLPLMKVREVTQDMEVVLDENFIAATYNVASSSRLRSSLKDVISMLKQRGDSLTRRSLNNSNTNSVADFMQLQLMNRYEAQLEHLSTFSQLHPERLIEVLIMLTSELAAFTMNEKRLSEYPQYVHESPMLVLDDIQYLLSQQLSVVHEERALQLPMNIHEDWMQVSPITDRARLNNSAFVLIVGADMPAEELRGQIPLHMKIGAVEEIRDLVLNNIPGIDLKPLQAAPRELPFSAGRVYFQMDSDSPHWKSLLKSSGFAFHISGNFPNLELQLWSIQGSF